MPTYEYVCSKCEHRFEKYQSISDNALSVCPKDLCGKKKWGKGKIKRAISTGGGLIFKGSGFYTTDYRSESYKASAKKDTPPSTSSSSDSKPASASTSTAATPAKSESKPAKPAPPAKA
jgi:putative FmdB family regulatory protein